MWHILKIHPVPCHTNIIVQSYRLVILIILAGDCRHLCSIYSGIRLVSQLLPHKSSMYQLAPAAGVSESVIRSNNIIPQTFYTLTQLVSMSRPIDSKFEPVLRLPQTDAATVNTRQSCLHLLRLNTSCCSSLVTSYCSLELPHSSNETL